MAAFSRKNVIFNLFVCACLFSTGALFAQDDSLIEYAEHQPLAAQSMLLDIIQTFAGYVAVGERGHIVLSEEGHDWRQAEAVPTRATLTVITQSGPNLWAAGHDTVILKSGDEGNTWTRVYHDPDLEQPIMDLHFTARGKGIAIGAYGLLLISEDRGETWQQHEISEDGWHLNALLDLGDGRLMIAGEAGFSYRSFDGGSSWETLEMPYPGSMFNLAERPDGCIIQIGLIGTVQETCDFGDTWNQANSGASSTLSGIIPTATGVLMVGNSGLVLRQDEDGNFRNYIHSSAVDFASVAARGAGFVLVGEDGIHVYPEDKVDGSDL